MKKNRRVVRKNMREKLPPNTVLVSRPSRWGNPCRITRGRNGWIAGCMTTDPNGSFLQNVKPDDGSGMVGVSRRFDTIEDASRFAVAVYGAMLNSARALKPDELRQWLAPLKGKRLACYCKAGTPCHADVLIEVLEQIENK